MHCDYGGTSVTTNNQMELFAAVKGLWTAERLWKTNEGVELISDSEYVLGIANRRLRASKNLGLVEELQRLAEAMKIKTVWVPGHKGLTFNEAADILAKLGKAEICAHPRCLKAAEFKNMKRKLNLEGGQK